MSIGEENRGTERDGGVVRRRRRRRWSKLQKRQIVAETHEPGVSVPMVAQRYNLNANQIFRWRRLFCELERAGGASRFVPVVVETAPGQEPDAATMSPPSESVIAEGQPATGRIKIVLAGDRRVIVDRAVDSSALSRVIAVLERRYRDIALCEACGAWPVPLLVDDGRGGIDQCSTTRLPAGGDRVA